jgi:hypothetical protein
MLQEAPSHDIGVWACVKFICLCCNGFWYQLTRWHRRAWALPPAHTAALSCAKRQLSTYGQRRKSRKLNAAWLTRLGTSSIVVARSAACQLSPCTSPADKLAQVWACQRCVPEDRPFLVLPIGLSVPITHLDVCLLRLPTSNWCSSYILGSGQGLLAHWLVHVHVAVSINIAWL